MNLRMNSLVRVGAIAAVAFFATPAFLTAFTTIGGVLPISTTGNGYQRDVRVSNNFQDAAANANTTPDPNYPGAIGAPLSIWKGAAAWGSNVASAGKNFDFDWQGETGGVGTVNDNIVSSLQAVCGGGVLAYTELGDGNLNGWRIRYCEDVVWSDNPAGASLPQFDIQSTLTHELGHALGLGHSQGNLCSGTCATDPIMCPVVCGSGSSQRVLRPDDASGLLSIYGAIPANKPTITSVTGALVPGGTIVINGTSFAANVNVKFTVGTGQDLGTIPGVVYGLASAGGGTQVAVTVPANVRSGNVLVWEPARNLLSNAFPVALSPPTILAVTPSSGRLRGGEAVTIDGMNFTTAATVTFAGMPASITTRNGSNQIIVQSPPGMSEGQAATVSVVQSSGTANAVGAFTYTPNPVELLMTGTPTYGSPVTFTVFGPANLRAAAAVGMVGTTIRRGVEVCLTRPTEVVRTPDIFRLDSLGQATMPWIPEGNPGDVRHAQAAIILPDRSIVLTNCIEIMVQ
ncbi:MAG: IPT/TIG domain-containing protein [Planctomycetes bacterium]|nr:IPT/TIG domain-containing protein [Planctomycetota bacterium]MBI3843411.1 IPT/TIG domain-containing protein [Planctomycetota bacterium]